MQHTPQQLKEKLLNSLDKNNHVVDMQGALEVITNLERNPISRHALETTRLGRMVNELRKNTVDRDLARRAKNLVRQWQELVSQSTPTSSSPQSRTSSPALHPLAAAAGRAGVSNGTQQSHESLYPKVVSGPSSLLRVWSTGCIGSADVAGSRFSFPSSSRQLSPGIRSVFQNYTGSRQLQPGGVRENVSGSPALVRAATIPTKLPPSQNALGYSRTPCNVNVSPLFSHTAAPNQRSSMVGPGLAPSGNGLQPDGAQSFFKSHVTTIDTSLGNGILRHTLAVPESTVSSDTQTTSLGISSSPTNARVATGSIPFSSSLVKSATNSNHFHGPQDLLKRSTSAGANIRAIDSCTLGHISSAQRTLPVPVTHSSPVEAVSGISNCNSEAEESSTFSVSRISKKRQRSGSPIGLKIKIKKSRIVSEELNTSAVDVVSTPTKKPVGRPRKIMNGATKEDQNHAASNSSMSTSVMSGLKMKIDLTSGSGETSGTPPLPSASAPRTTVGADRKGGTKVATTAELIQKLHAKGELRLVASDTLERIATNKIVKEVDVVNPSVVDFKTGHSKHGKKDLAAANAASLGAVRLKEKERQAADAMKRIKTEMVHKFLNTAVSENDTPYAADESSRDFGRMGSWSETNERSGLLNLIEHLDPVPLPEEIIAATTIVRIKPVVRPVEETKHLVVTDAEVNSPNADDPWSQLPVVDPDSINWDSLEYEAPPVERLPVGPTDVDRVCNEQWEGVNGMWTNGRDGREWRDWTQTFTTDGYDGSLLHILPYVNIDD